MRILKRSISTLALIFFYTRANVQSAMEYRTAFAVQILTMIGNDFLWLFYWWTYFQQFPLVNGWRNIDIVILWAVGAGSFGLSVGIFGNARQIASLVMNGGLDAYLGMPRYALLHVCIATSDPIAWGDIIFSLGAFLLLVHPGPLQMVIFLFCIMMGALIITSFLIILCSLAFFLGNVDGLAQQMLGALISFSTYPMDIFHGVVRVLLFTVVPAGFISFIPLQLLHSFSWPLLGGLIAATGLILALAAGMFELGVRRYESGNLLGMQG
jgi:ABC-2 type transport system permease protein